MQRRWPNQRGRTSRKEGCCAYSGTSSLHCKQGTRRLIIGIQEHEQAMWRMSWRGLSTVQ